MAGVESLKAVQMGTKDIGKINQVSLNIAALF